jgi:hypothetical protein
LIFSISASRIAAHLQSVQREPHPVGEFTVKKGDLKDIKLHGPAFAGSWWKEKAPDDCQGLGVEKALDNWKSACIDPGYFNDLDEIDKAESAAAELIKALVKARKQADKETGSAITEFEKVIKDYLKSTETVKKEMQEDEKESSDLVEALRQVRSREMYYGLVRKGKTGCLFVSKKNQVCTRLVRKAKANNEDVKGGQVYIGKCDFANGRCRFHFDEKPPELKLVLRQLLSPAGMKPGICINGVDLESSVPERFAQAQLNVKLIREANGATEDTIKSWLLVLQSVKTLLDAEDTDTADDKLDDIEPAILSALGSSRVEQAGRDTGSNVNKARLAVRDVRFASIRSVGKLIESLRATKDPRAGWIADFLVGLCKEFPESLEKALEDLDKAIKQGAPDTALKPLKDAVEASSKAWLLFLQRNAGYVEGCEKNPWKIPLSLRTGITSAIKQALTTT